MKVLISFIFTSLIMLTACGLLGSDDEPGIPGTIVFSADDEAGTPQIYTMNADGSGVRQLTYFGTDDGAVQPSWSPDGRQIVFSTTLRSSSNGLSLYIMDADGDNMRPMNEREGSPIPTPGNHARWSPDGTQIVFDRCTNCQVGTNIELFIYTFATDSVIQLTDTDYPVTNSNPTWSPDGSRITFVSNRDYVDADTLRFRKDLYVMSTNGSNQQRVTETGYAREPIQSPTKNTIAFRSTGATPGLYLVNIELHKITRIRSDSGERIHLHPNAWSPDGNCLLLTARDLDQSENTTLYIYNFKNDELNSIYSGSPISGADWFIPDD